MTTSLLAYLYWFHLIATVLWIGGLATLVLVAWPGILKSAGPQAAAIFDEIEKRFRPIANTSLIVLLVTGMLQMSVDEHYIGMFVIDGPWAINLLLKHIAFGGMIVVAVILQLFVLPELGRARLLSTRSKEAAGDEAKLRWRVQQLTILDLGLSALILLFTAFMTAQ